MRKARWSLRCLEEAGGPFSFSSKIFRQNAPLFSFGNRRGSEASRKGGADMNVTPNKPPGRDAEEERLNVLIAVCVIVRWLAEQARKQLEKEKALRRGGRQGGNQDE